MAKRREPITQRREQIGREIARLQNSKNLKKRDDFKSCESFEKWQFVRAETLRELYEELAIIEYPSEYYDVPIAIAASELGLILGEIDEILAENLVPLSSSGVSPAADRINRDEIGNALDIGSDELLRQARLEIPELFREAVDALARGDIELARIIYDRIDRHDSCINPYALACEIGIQFVSKNVGELDSSFKFILGRDNSDSLSAIFTTRELLFQDTYSQYQATSFASQRTEEQNLAILIGDVIMDSVKTYKFVKSITSSRGYLSDNREAEILRVVQNAAYTALEAYKNYNESPSSKMFVDRYVGVKTKRRQAPVLLGLLPEPKKLEKLTPPG